MKDNWPIENPIPLIARGFHLQLVERKGKGKERMYLYSAFIVATTLKALRRGSHSFTCK